MALTRFILILFAIGLLSACAAKPGIDRPVTGSSPEPSQVTKQPSSQPPEHPSEQQKVSKQQESSIDGAKHLELKAFLNQHGTVSLHINNHSALNIDNIFVALRLRYSARIVSNMLFKVPQGIKAGQSLEVDTEIPLPTARSIIRAQVIKVKIAP